MIRRLAFTVLLLSLPGISFALGLGKLDLKSKLNEPFEARIELLSASADELDSLKVNLAGAEDFSRAEIERSFNLTKLKFDIKETSKGADYIRVYSQDPIQEPFLNFLIEINWNRGRLLREYTALMDPPTYTAVPRSVTALPVAPATSNRQVKPIPVVNKSGQATARTTTPVPAGNAYNQPPSYINQTTGSTGRQYESTASTTSYTPSYTGGDFTTSRGDTLWAIASQMRPERSVSIQQMMLALYRSNPEAFVDDNINNLKTGQVLSNPDLSDVQSLSQSEAIAQVRQHNDMWQGFKQAIAEQVETRPESTGDSLPAEDNQDLDTASADAMPSETMPEESDPELRLVGSEDSSTGVGQGSGDAGSDSAVMDQDLALAEESMVALESENKELKEKLIEAESLIDDLNRLIVLKEDELSALRDQLSLSGAEELAMDEEIPLEEEVMEDMLPEEAFPEEEVLEEPPIEDQLPEEGMLDDELLDESTMVPDEPAYDDSTNFIQEEEELPQTDPTEYGELYDEDAMSEEFPGESDFDEEVPMEEGFVDDEFADDDFVEDDFTEEPLDDAAMDTEVFPDETVDELAEETFTEVPEEAESDSGLSAVSGVLDTVNQYFGPMLDFVKQNLTLLGSVLGGLLALFLGYMGFKKFRGEKEEVLELDDDDDLLSFDDADSGSVEVDLSDSDANDTLVMDAPIDLDTPMESTETEAERTAAHDFSDSQPPGYAEPENRADSDEDPLAEVNVFLAYEHFDQAEEFVKKELQIQPDNLDYHNKLLEVFYAAGDKKSYEEAAKVLHDKVGGSGEHWDMALAMWAEMSPNREIFSERMDGLDDTQALAPGSAEDALNSGIVDLTANEPNGTGLESDLVETSVDVLDITGQNQIIKDITLSGEQDLIETVSEATDLESLSDENILDVSTHGTDDSQLLNMEASGEQNAIIDSSLPIESTEHILDLTGGDGEEDILDITAGSQEDLLDVTASTDLSALPSVTRESDIQEESTLDFDVQGLNLDLPSEETKESDSISHSNTIERAMDTIESSKLIIHPDDDNAVDDSNVVDLDLPGGDTDVTATALDLDISGAFDLSGGTDKAESVLSEAVTVEMDPEQTSIPEEMTVELSPEDSSAAEETETSFDIDMDSEENTLDFDLPGEDTDDLKHELEDADDEGGAVLDLTNEFTLDEENTDSMSDGFDLELQDDDDEELPPNTELDIDMEGTVEMPQGTLDAQTVEMPKIDYVDDEDDKTVFIPRSAGSEQQSLEDEVSTKLDLAKAYVELGDNDSAKTILDEIVAEGNPEQKKIAEQLLTQVT